MRHTANKFQCHTIDFKQKELLRDRSHQYHSGHCTKYCETGIFPKRRTLYQRTCVSSSTNTCGIFRAYDTDQDDVFLVLSPFSIIATLTYRLILNLRAANECANQTGYMTSWRGGQYASMRFAARVFVDFTADLHMERSEETPEGGDDEI